jgi:hypothetical protein
MGLTMGKIIFGKLTVDTPKHEVLHIGNGYEIRKYPPCVSAEVTYLSKDMKRGRDGGLEILADYIGAFGKPHYTKPKKIAMAAPVITSSNGGNAEATAMKAPVITSSSGGEAEAISMTAPVITGEGRDRHSGKVTMQVLLPSNYTKVEETPRPTDERVVLREVGERKYGVVKFAGLTGEKVVAERAARLKAALEKDGHVVTGPYLFSRYNPPRTPTLPPLRTNEVMFPVE